MGRCFRTILKSVLGLGLFLGLWSFGSPSSLAYPTPVDFSGKLLRWDISPENPTVTYGIDAENPDDATYYQSIIEQSAELWSAVPGSYFRFKLVPLEDNPQVTVYLRSSLTGVRDTAGYTMFDQYADEKPTHCSVYIQVDQSTADYWMAKIFLHELGHAAGLGHSLVPEAIMSYSLDINAFALDSDDDAAIAHSYPANGDKPRLPVGCSIGASDAQSPLGVAWCLFLLVVPALLSLWPASGRSRLWRAT